MFHDLMLRHVHSGAHFELMRYAAWLPGWFHLAFATPSGLSTGLQWPTAHTTSAATTARHVAILDQLQTNQWALPARQRVGTTVGRESCEIRANAFRWVSHECFF